MHANDLGWELMETVRCKAGGFLLATCDAPASSWGMPSLEFQLDQFLRKQPQLGRSIYIAKGAVVIGDVTLGNDSSIWYNAVVRGDINCIVIGQGTNVQDNAVLHLADDYPCILGEYVTVGHSAVVHACTVEDQSLVGMGATILDGAVIGAQSIIGANALVTQGTCVPPGSMVLGSPAKVVRRLTASERKGLKPWAEKYVANAAYCLKHGIEVGKPRSSRPLRTRKAQSPARVISRSKAT